MWVLYIAAFGALCGWFLFNEQVGSTIACGVLGALVGAFVQHIVNIARLYDD